jgi:hypothetical protein
MNGNFVLYHIKTVFFANELTDPSQEILKVGTDMFLEFIHSPILYKQNTTFKMAGSWVVTNYYIIRVSWRRSLIFLACMVLLYSCIKLRMSTDWNLPFLTHTIEYVVYFFT